MSSYESPSTWFQREPLPSSPQRTALIGEVAARIVGSSPQRLRVAIDGPSGSGKTSFGHEVATAVRELGRPTLRASLDDFKHPWADAREKGYDRLSGEGYYRNAYDFESSSELLLRPAGASGSGLVVLCAHDPLNGVDMRDHVFVASHNAVLIVDSAFAFRPQYNEHWEYRIWLEVDDEIAIARGIARDAELDGLEAATTVHRGRYQRAQEIYVAEVNPRDKAELMIDNNDFSTPRIIQK